MISQEHGEISIRLLFSQQNLTSQVRKTKQKIEK